MLPEWQVPIQVHCGLDRCGIVTESF